jgi:hypothetical protein
MLPIKSRVKKDLFPKIMKEGVFLHSTNFYIRYLDRKDSLPDVSKVPFGEVEKEIKELLNKIF